MFHLSRRKAGEKGDKENGEFRNEVLRGVHSSIVRWSWRWPTSHPPLEIGAVSLSWAGDTFHSPDQLWGLDLERQAAWVSQLFANREGVIYSL
jgi:hypothetical protein